MMRQTAGPGPAEITAIRRRSRHALLAALVFSVFINLLMLTSPLYMLQVYDRVLASRSEPTLLALSLIVAFLFAIMGFLDHARGRILARVGARLQDALDARVLSAALRRLAERPGDGPAHAALHDLDAVARLWSLQVVTALIDLPWTVVFSAALFVFHPLLGAFALGGMALLALLAWANRQTVGPAANAATLAAIESDRLVDGLIGESDAIRAMGMTGQVLGRWRARRGVALRAALRADDLAGAWGSTSRTLRLFLQSAILGLGALLVLRGAISAGAMIAASILLGRALQPLEAVIVHWPQIVRARSAASRLGGLLAAVPPEEPRTPLPRPHARLAVEGLTVVPPGARTPVLRGIDFRLEPGQALGVIGPSGSGKSALARALCGAWPAAAGSVRLGGATLGQYDLATLGRHIGYLPQRVTLFEGTIAENIARLDPSPDPGRVVAAARRAAAHAMIVGLPDGYDTRLGPAGVPLSGGQIQRIGLARALHGDPVLIILDEPDTGLDSEGMAALDRAIGDARAAGAAVVVMAHRLATVAQCDLLLVLREGAMQAFGPRERILRRSPREVGPARFSSRGVAAGAVAGA